MVGPAASQFDTRQETANFIAYHEDMTRREGYADPAGWALTALRELDEDCGARPDAPSRLVKEGATRSPAVRSEQGYLPTKHPIRAPGADLVTLNY